MRGIVAREPFKNTVLGIIVLGVISGVIANQFGVIDIRGWFVATSKTETQGRLPNSTGTAQPSDHDNTPTQPIYSEAVSTSQAIHDYNLTYRNLTLSGPASLEGLYGKAKVVISMMTDIPQSRGGKSYLQRLTLAEVEPLAQQLPGIKFQNDDVTGAIARIDSAFFLAFARKDGKQTDVDFFENWRQEYPNEQWMPRWIQQQTDYSGCTDFGGGKLVELFRMWSNYRSKYPGDYADDVQARIEGLRGVLARDTCACGDKESVETELQRFLAEFPSDSAEREVSIRLHDIQTGKSKIRFNCLLG